MKDNRDEIYSKSLRAGRRTYFFDVRSTRADDFYLTVTESKRDFNTDGTPFYKKHKIYLYKEDFQNFKDHMNEMMDYIIKERGEEIISLNKEEIEEETNSIIEKTEVTEITEPIESIEPKEDSITEFTEVNFDDLGKEEKE
tara:strand:- start:865 stop:1287 length:423 start_codon:yes stop_codon:yes gene_type:complete